ncbi:MAG: hypothetical protein ACK5QH_20490 [Rubrivivax sp.]
MLLTSQGQQQALKAKAFDAEGRLVSSAVTWQASRPSEVAVADDGTVRAVSAVGSGQVVAVVDGVRSAPVLVAVAQPAAGVLLVGDAQVVSDPVVVEAAAEPDIDNPYEVVLSGVPMPAVGSLLLGREGKTVGGEVLAATQEATGVRVRLKTVALDRLVSGVRVQERIDLTGLPLEVPADVAALYTVTQEGDEHVFTPRPGVASSPPSADDRKRAKLFKPFKMGPFNCELVGSELPISMPQPASFKLKFVPNYVVDYESSTGLRKLLLQAEASFQAKNNLQINAAGLVNLTCEATLLQRLVPLPGLLGLLLAGELQAGVGLETEGSVAIPLLGAELTLDAKGQLEAGLDCTSGTCKTVSKWEPTLKSGLRYLTPSGALAEARSELFFYTYGFGKMNVGATLSKALRVEAVKVRAGPKFEANLAPVLTQLLPVSPGLPDYRSDYKAHLLVEGTAGSKVQGDTKLVKLLQKLGIFKATLLKVQLSLPLGNSPKGTVSVSGPNAAQDGEFIDGKTFNFKVKLDPANARFPVLGYNVRRVRVYYISDGMLPREVAQVDAAADQTEFDLSWVAEGTSGASGRRFAAFVDTVLPTPVSLELGAAQPVPEVFSGRMTATSNVFSPAFVPAVGATYTVQSSGKQGYSFDGLVETGSFNSGLVGTALNTDVVYDGTGLIREPVSATNGCKYVKNTETITNGSGAAQGIGNGTLEIDTVAGVWRLSTFRVQMPATGTKTQRTFATERSLACTTPFNEEATTTTLTAPFDAFFYFSSTGVYLSGAIGVDSDGRRTIRYTGTPVAVSQGGSSRTVTLALDLKEGPSKLATTDLSVALVATPTVKPLGTLTYSVNLQNKGSAAATEVRTEFVLPTGWSVVGQVGWSGCSTSVNTVVCRAERMEAGEQRAFLVDVQAPEALGLYTISARVSSAEVDTDFSNNRTETISNIVE